MTPIFTLERFRSMMNLAQQQPHLAVPLIREMIRPYYSHITFKSRSGIKYKLGIDHVTSFNLLYSLAVSGLLDEFPQEYGRPEEYGATWVFYFEDNTEDLKEFKMPTATYIKQNNDLFIKIIYGASSADGSLYYIYFILEGNTFKESMVIPSKYGKRITEDEFYEELDKRKVPYNRSEGLGNLVADDYDWIRFN